MVHASKWSWESHFVVLSEVYIMVDETTDLSNTEQMVFCLRHVDDHFDVHEEVIGLHSLESTSADRIVFTKLKIYLFGLIWELITAVVNVTMEQARCLELGQVFPLK